MNFIHALSFFLLTTLPVIASAQNPSFPQHNADSTKIIFKDTLHHFVFDTLDNHLGTIPSKNNRVVKYFKYLGTDSVHITRTWTSDPHFICKYPKELLIPHKIYSIQVCFFHNGRQGHFHKKMGFDLSNGNRILYRFTGQYSPLEKDDVFNTNSTIAE